MIALLFLLLAIDTTYNLPQDSMIGKIIVDTCDSIITTHYYDGARPYNETGRLVESYDGCNWIKYLSKYNNLASGTLLYCEHSEGDTIRTWNKYMLNKNRYIIMHGWYVYKDFRLKKW